MKISTKYDAGQKVWIVDHSCIYPAGPAQHEIESVVVGRGGCRYRFAHTCDEYPENEVYDTQEEAEKTYYREQLAALEKSLEDEQIRLRSNLRSVEARREKIREYKANIADVKKAMRKLKPPRKAEDKYAECKQ